MSNVYKGTVSVLAILAISCVAFIAIANADDKANSTNAENAVAVPQTANLTPAQKFFANMSPEEFRNPIALDDFISRFPNSPEARVVFAIRFSLVEKFPTIEGYNDFIKKYPDKLQTQVAIQEVFKLYCEQNRVAGYYDFIQRYPNTEQSLVAMMYIQEIMFQYACQLDTEEEYDAFIEAFPDAPQVKAAQEKAKIKAIEKEKKDREDLEKKIREELEKKKDNEIEEKVNKEITKIFNEKITKWQTKRPNKLNNKDTNTLQIEGNNVSKDVSNKEVIDISLDEWLKAYKWYRQAEVYQTVYPGIGNIGDIQATLDRYEIKIELGKIEKTINNNHEKLISQLEIISNNISEKLGEISKNQKNICEELKKGFNNLHEDLKQIHKDLSDINRSVKETNNQLAKLNDKLDIIASLFQVAITGNPLPMLGVYVEKIKSYTDSFVPDDIVGKPFNFVEYRQRTTRPMDQIAACGYENVDKNMFHNTEVGNFICTVKDKWQSLPKINTNIGKFLRYLVENTLEFVPFIGPSIVHKAGEAVEYYVDGVLVPYVMQKIDELKENIELCREVFNQYKSVLINVAQEWIITFIDNNFPPEVIEKLKTAIPEINKEIKDLIENSNIENVKSFVELVKQVAQKIIEIVKRETTVMGLPIDSYNNPDLKHTVEIFLDNVCYIR